MGQATETRCGKKAQKQPSHTKGGVRSEVDKIIVPAATVLIFTKNTRHGWGDANPAYGHRFSQTFMPDAVPEDLA